MPEPILNSDEQKQLEWSKNWHTQRVNYMPWTDAQKSAYLRAIDSTYDEGGVTKDVLKPMGFTPKGNNININYENAENTTYGNMAKGSGLVHELAHKLSYNANNELNAIDNSVPTQEDALLRAQKLNRLMHPLEIGGLQNANNFVDYNAQKGITQKQEKIFRKNGIYNSKNVEDDAYGHNAIEVKAKLDELRYRLNLKPEQMDIKPESVKMWRGRGIFPSSLDDYSDEQIAKMLNTFAYNNSNNDIANYAKQGGKLTKYSELSDKERYEIIKLGVQNGMTNLDDIEKAYNEYAKGGYVNDEYYNNTLLRKDEQQKQNIKEQLEKRKTYSLGGNISHKFGDGSNIYGYSENDNNITFYKDVDDIYVTPNGNYYEGDEYNKRKQKDIMSDINNNPALLFTPEYNDWYNYYRGLSKKEGWNFDSQMSEIFNRLPFEEQEWVIQNNPSAFNLLPQDVKSDYITRTKGMRPGAFKRLVDDAGENFLGKSVNNAVTAASLISLPTALKSGKLIKSGIDKIADVGYKALNSTNVGRNATNLMTKAVLPAVETKWGIEGAKNLPNDLRNVGQAINEGDYVGAGFEGINAAFDTSMIPLGAKNISGITRGIKNEVGKVVENVGKRVNPLGKPVVQKNFSNVKPNNIDKMNKAYEQAFKAGDYETGQRLWDKWFNEQAKRQGFNTIKNKQGHIETTNHTVADKFNPHFNSFNTNIEGKPTAVYTTNNRDMSESYFHDRYIAPKGMERDGVIQMLSDEIQNNDNNLKSIIERYKWSLEHKDKVNNVFLKNLEKRAKNAEEELEKTKNISIRDRAENLFKERKLDVSGDIESDRVKELYGVMKNPLVINANGSHWNSIRFNFPNKLWGSTRDIENYIRNGGKYDGAIVKNVVDYGSSPVSKFNPGNVYEFLNPEQIKYKNPFTLDDSGNLIPLSKRGNFNINDLRYSLLPITGIGIYGLQQYLNNKDYEQNSY